jgi:hypothetical protein
VWTPDSDLLLDALETVTAEQGALLADPGSAPHARGLLEALGTVVALDHRVPHVEASVIDHVGAWLEGADLAELDEATAEVSEQAGACLTLLDECVPETLAGVLAGLRTRDEVELAWLGAEALGIAGRWSSLAGIAREAFDQAIQGVVWQLSGLGERRTLEAGWLAPRHRSRFWWRTRGAELPPDAITNPALAKDVLQVFPEALPFVAGLVKRPSDLITHVAIGRGFEALLQDARGAARVDAHGRLRAAAADAPTGPVSLLRHEAVDLSWFEQHLLVDVLPELAPGAVPVLLDGASVLHGVAADYAVRRFVFDLAGRDVATTRWRLVVPLADTVLDLEVG